MVGEVTSLLPRKGYDWFTGFVPFFEAEGDTDKEKRENKMKLF